jgi:hypothetical protein
MLFNAGKEIRKVLLLLKSKLLEYILWEKENENN